MICVATKILPRWGSDRARNFCRGADGEITPKAASGRLLVAEEGERKAGGTMILQ